MIKNIVIVGGGSAGWMTATALSNVLGRNYNFTLVESDDIGIIGVGESTIPPVIKFNQIMGLNESEFMRETKATYKLGIEFVDWNNIGDQYIHGFGTIGDSSNMAEFQHYWIKHYQGKGNFDDYTLCSVAAKKNKFFRPEQRGSLDENIGYAYHLDAYLYAKYLRKISEQRGVKRVEGKIVQVKQKDNGYIDSVILENGNSVSGDLFIDCSGFKGLLIGETLNSEFESWNQWLLNDTAIAISCERDSDIRPVTRCTARTAGWQWHIPQTHRSGEGHVFSSKYMSVDEATNILLNTLPTKAISDPKVIKFKPGIRRKPWVKNCIAIGLSNGFLEPLESTSLYFSMNAINKLIWFFPKDKFNQLNIDEYNRIISQAFEQTRDFLILHYHLNNKTDLPYWNYLRTMDVPDRVKNKIELYKNGGRTFRENDDLFCEPNWLQVMQGQGVVPESYNPIVDNITELQLKNFMDKIRLTYSSVVANMPSHEQFIRR